MTAETTAQAPNTDEWEYELRMPDGRLAGLYHVHDLQARIYNGSVTAECTVRRPAPGPAWPADSADAGPWEPLWTVPALARVMDLLGMERGQAEEKRQISRWRKSADADDVDHTQPSLSRVDLPVAKEAAAPERSLMPLIVGTVILVLVLLVVGLVLAS